MELLKELMVLTEGKKSDNKIVVKTPKPRAKPVNDVLRTRKGGRMKADTDYDRNAAKRDTRKALTESETGYFWYEARWEVKNRSGEGPEEELRHDDGIVKANSKEEAIAKLRARLPRGAEIRAGASTKADYDREQD